VVTAIGIAALLVGLLSKSNPASTTSNPTSTTTTRPASNSLKYYCPLSNISNNLFIE